MTTQRALDPNLSAQDLWVLVQSRPDLHAAIALHPNAYPGLLQYLSTLDDPFVRQALVDRGYFSAVQASPAGFSPSGPDPAVQAPAKGLAKIPLLGWVGIAAAAVVVIAGGSLLLLQGSRKGGEVDAEPPAVELVEEERDPVGEEELQELEPVEADEQEELIEEEVLLPEATACPPGISVPSGVDADLVCAGAPADAVVVTAQSAGWLVGVLPSGNIGCEADPSRDDLSCKIIEKNWPDMDDHLPADATGWCAGFHLEQGGETRVDCGTDPPLWTRPSADGGVDHTMQYDNNYLFGRYVCNAAETGLTCWDPQTAHGFFLSRAKWEEW